MKLQFDKEDNKWYINLPDYPGDKADLQMVLGADTLLDILSSNADSVLLNVSLTDNTLERLTKIRDMNVDEGGGAMYFSNTHKFDLWLCDVTKFVFDGFPSEIFYSVN